MRTDMNEEGQTVLTEALLASKILLDPTFDIMTPLDVTMNSSVIQVAKNANFSIFFEYFQIMKSVKSYIKDVRPAPPGGLQKSGHNRTWEEGVNEIRTPRKKLNRNDYPFTRIVFYQRPIYKKVDPPRCDVCTYVSRF